jgi:hypothetical protein
MQYFLNDNVFGPYSGIQWGKKGEPVSLIAEHGSMAIVKGEGQAFAVKMEKLSNNELQNNHAAIETKQEERQVYIKSKSGKKSVTNPSINIQSLF